MGGADGSTRLPMGPPNIEVFMQTKMLQTNFSFFCHKIETKVGTIWPLWQFLMKGTTSFLSFLLSSLSLSLSLSLCLPLTLSVCLSLFLFVSHSPNLSRFLSLTNCPPFPTPSHISKQTTLFNHLVFPSTRRPCPCLFAFVSFLSYSPVPLSSFPSPSRSSQSFEDFSVPSYWKWKRPLEYFCV